MGTVGPLGGVQRSHQENWTTENQSKVTEVAWCARDVWAARSTALRVGKAGGVADKVHFWSLG